LPYEEELALPLLDTIAKAVNAKVLYNEDLLDNKVRNIIAGSLIDLNELKNFSNQLLVVSISRLDEALKKLNEVTRLVSQDTNPLSGIILTGRGELTEAQCAYFQSQRIPVLYAKIDTYEVVMKISRIEVKINVRTPWKVQKAISLFKEHINLDPIFAYQA
jgi:BioD-like phosphotransacetylase family protein